MARIDYSFQGPGGALNLVCRVKDFWEEKKKTYCFSEEVRGVDWRFDYKLRARVSVFPHPTSLHPSKAQYVLSEPESGFFQKIYFTIGPETLAIELRLFKSDGKINEDLPWHQTQNGKPCIAWEKFVQFYRIDLLVVFEPPPAGPPPIELEWSRRFFPGGLPSLGKRR
jgi:hypothetical protein